MSPLGVCPNCGHLVRLTPAGTLGRHLRDGVHDAKHRHRRWLCPGTGRWPRSVGSVVLLDTSAGLPCSGRRRFTAHRQRRLKAPCRDCRVDTLDMPGNSGGDYLSEYYMVHDDVWAQAGMASDGGWLCIGCLQRRLARHLTGRDLTGCQLNRPGYGNDTPRLAALKLAAALARFIRGEPGW